MLTVILALLYLAVGAIFGIAVFIVSDEFSLVGRGILGLVLGLFWPITLVGGLIINAISEEKRSKPFIFDGGGFAAIIQKSSEEFRKKLDWVMNPVVLVVEKGDKKILCTNQFQVFDGSKSFKGTPAQTLGLRRILSEIIVPRLRAGEDQIIEDGVVYRRAKSEDVAPVFEKALLEKLDKANEDVPPNSMVSFAFWLNKVFTNNEIQVLNVLEDEWGEDRSNRWLVEVLQRSGKFRDAGDGYVEPA